MSKSPKVSKNTKKFPNLLQVSVLNKSSIDAEWCIFASNCFYSKCRQTTVHIGPLYLGNFCKPWFLKGKVRDKTPSGSCLLKLPHNTTNQLIITNNDKCLTAKSFFSFHLFLLLVFLHSHHYKSNQIELIEGWCPAGFSNISVLPAPHYLDQICFDSRKQQGWVS